MIDERKSTILALISVLIWSTVPTGFKLSLQSFSVTQFLFISSITSFTILLIISPFTKKDSEKINKKAIGLSAVLGLLNPFLYYFILLRAYDLLPAQQAQPLNMIWPIVLTLLASFVLKQKIHFKDFVAMLISFIGVMIISTEGNLLSFKIKNVEGVVLALSSSIIWATYWIVSMKSKLLPVKQLTLSFLFGAIYSTILFLFDYQPIYISTSFYASLYIGMFEMSIPFILWLFALKFTKSTARISNYIFLAPFISLIFLYFIIGERVMISTIAGAIFIILGIIYQNYSRGKRSTL